MSKKRKQQQVPEVGPNTPLPTTIDEAVAFLQKHTDRRVIAEIKATPFADLIRFHRDIGMQVRDILGLWGSNPVLINSLPKEHQWPDNACSYIIEAWWRYLQETVSSTAASGK